MKAVMKVILGLVGLFISINGAMFMFNPEFVMAHAQLSSDSSFGLSTVRGLIGGSMLMTGSFILVALIKSKFELLIPAVFILLSWTVGRIFSLLLDGFDQSVLTGGILVSLVMAILVIVSYKVLNEKKRS